MKTRECRLCHRIGPRGFVPVGAEAWECTNDRACKLRAAKREQVEDERRWNEAVDTMKVTLERTVTDHDAHRRHSIYRRGDGRYLVLATPTNPARATAENVTETVVDTRAAALALALTPATPPPARPAETTNEE